MPLGEAERPQRVLPAGPGTAPLAHGAHEGDELLPQRLGVVDRQLLHGETGGSRAPDVRRSAGLRDGRRPHEQRLLVVVVEREVALPGEDAEAAHPLERDAARREVRDAARGEGDAGVRQVLVGPEDGHADGVDPLRVLAHQVAHEVEVVDHEVHHDADVGRAAT